MVPRLYDDLAHLWPLLSPPEDSAVEARKIRDLIDRFCPASATRRRCILELGAGGGHTLYHLRDSFDVVAIDVSERMLAVCRRLNPRVPAHLGDMRNVRLDQTFDAVLIHDAIDYIIRTDDVLAVLSTAAAHLKPGGLVIVGPTYLAETFTNHAIEHDGNAGENLEVSFVTYVRDPDPADTTFELTMLLLIRSDRQLRIEEDRHICGLFSRQSWLKLLDDAGFNVEVSRNAGGEPYHLFVGRKR